MGIIRESVTGLFLLKKPATPPRAVALRLSIPSRNCLKAVSLAQMKKPDKPVFSFVGKGGIEPPRITPYDFESYASANSATRPSMRLRWSPVTHAGLGPTVQLVYQKK